MRQGCSGALKMRCLSGSKYHLFSWKSYFRFGKIAFPGRQDGRNCVRIVLAPWTPCSIGLEKSLFEQNIVISLRFRKFAFSGRQDARNCVKVVLAPSKSVPFLVRKNRLSSWQSDFFQVRKNCFFRSPRRSKYRQGCFGDLKMRPVSC